MHKQPKKKWRRHTVSRWVYLTNTVWHLDKKGHIIMTTDVVWK